MAIWLKVPSINVPGIYFERGMQLAAYDLLCTNSGVTADVWKRKYRVVYGTGTAFTNNQGYGETPDRADFVNNVNVTNELPKLMKAIVCAGNFFTGQKVGSEIVMTPGVDAIDGNRPIPSLEVVERRWCFFATPAKYDAAGVWRVNHFPQGAGGPVLIPYILKQPAQYSAAFFEPWQSDSLPDPLKVY